MDGDGFTGGRRLFVVPDDEERPSLRLLEDPPDVFAEHAHAGYSGPPQTKTQIAPWDQGVHLILKGIQGRNAGEVRLGSYDG